MSKIPYFQHKNVLRYFTFFFRKFLILEKVKEHDFTQMWEGKLKAANEQTKSRGHRRHLGGSQREGGGGGGGQVHGDGGGAGL